MAMKTQEESDVGILCYISELPGFRGILKQRYSDFIVNEVDLNGNVVHLKSLDSPPEPILEKETKIEDQSNKSYTAEIELFRSLAGDSNAELLKSFTDQIASGNGEDISPIVLSPSSDKSQRTAIHNFFKEHMKFLVTDTVDGPDASSKCIRVRLNSKGNDNRGRNSKKRKDRGDKPFDSRGSENWQDHVGRFLRFTLYKENKDTQEALGVIGKMLGLSSRSFGFAGTKDKRSVSTQMVTVYKQKASRLAALNKKLIGMKVGDFCYVQEGLVLGQLMGNRFTIALRGVVADSEDTIKAAAESLGKQGFINYFGLQRFGSGSVPTHVVGATLLRGKWKTAVKMILDPREGERDAIQRAREYYKESGDIEGTLRQLPRYMVAERAILQCLKKSPENYLQALKAIPRTLRMMFVHSYQSYLWNHAASMRVQKYGFDKVVLGDLVYCKEGDTGEEVKFTNSECLDEDSIDTDDCTHLDDISGSELPEEKCNLVKAVTNEDIISRKYTIDDIVLPMPGSKVIYPENDIAQLYYDLARKDSISLTESVHNVKEFSMTCMSGSYRRVFQKPIDFEWELLTYTDGNIPLSETDLDKIVGDKSTGVVKGLDTDYGNAEKFERKHNVMAVDTDITVVKEDLCSENKGRNQVGNMNQSEICTNTPPTERVLDHNEESMAVVKEDNQSNRKEEKNQLECVKQSEKVGNATDLFSEYNDAVDSRSTSSGIQRALKLSFTLPASCYATMAIRELLKTSTSVAFHKSLN